MKKINYKEIAKRYITRLKESKNLFKGYYQADNWTYVIDGCSYIRLPDEVFNEVIKPYFDGLNLDNGRIVNNLKSLIDQSKNVSYLFNYEIAGDIDDERKLLTYGNNYKCIATKYIKPYLKYDGLYYVEPGIIGNNNTDGQKTPLLIVNSDYEIIAYILPVTTGKSLKELSLKVERRANNG